MKIVPLKKADDATTYVLHYGRLLETKKTYSLASLWGWHLMKQQPSQGINLAFSTK